MRPLDDDNYDHRTSVIDKWEVVFPWCRHLRGRLQLQHREVCDTSVRRRFYWLLVTLPKYRKSTSKGQVQRIRQAIELLSLVALVDDAAWKLLLQIFCGVHFDPNERILQDEPLAPRFMFVFDDHIVESLMWPVSLCSKFFFPPEPKGEENLLDHAMYMTVRRQVLEIGNQIYQQANRKVDDFVTPIGLHFAPRGVDSYCIAVFLQGLLKTLQDIRLATSIKSANCEKNKIELLEKDGGPSSPGLYPFKLETLQFNISAFEVTEPVALVLQDILALNFHVSLIQLPLKCTDFLSDVECPRQPLAACLTDAVAYNKNKTIQTKASVGVESLVVNDVDIDDRRFAALCSALAVSSSVKKLTLDSVFLADLPRARALKWKWLAFALFSRESQSSVTKLMINDAQLRAMDVNSIANVVKAVYPVKEIFDPLWSLDDQMDNQYHDDDAHSVCIRKGAVIYLEPHCYEEELEKLTLILDQDEQFLVMNNNLKAELIEIFVPGYGKCWVDREAVLKIDTRPTSSESENASSSGGVTSLILNIDLLECEANESMLPRLLQLIGAKLQTLHLHTHYLRGESLEGALHACPNLTRLTLQGAELHSKDTLVDWYDKWGCRLSSVTITDVQLNNLNLSDFLAGLGDPSSSALRFLRELWIGGIACVKARDKGDELLQEMLALLEKNHALEYLELHVDSLLYNRYVPLFARYHGQVLPPVYERMVSLRCKLAFLSVVKRSTKKSSDKNGNSMIVYRLDANSMELIFVYAATYATRCVCLVEC